MGLGGEEGEEGEDLGVGCVLGRVLGCEVID